MKTNFHKKQGQQGYWKQTYFVVWPYVATKGFVYECAVWIAISQINPKGLLTNFNCIWTLTQTHPIVKTDCYMQYIWSAILDSDWPIAGHMRKQMYK